ncbi:MAG TPA: aspartyl/asparaginyl beta-hydroxylase domain-containing protein [Alphaproteobacteria bacterium]|nr:aspartyl/asparaginyl beta-hydroxylase domain-containing protein [Alphaproteobacteria bacterium]
MVSQSQRVETANEQNGQIGEVANSNIANDPAFKKRSFLKLPVEIDVKRLVDEYNSIPEEAWGTSFWDAHCSIDVLTLRAGTNGDDTDYITDNVSDNPILKDYPYISWLLSEDSPFGRSLYVVMFRMRPKGITRIHPDNHEAWETTHRIHIPLTTNDGAFLLSEGRAKHIPVGEVWTFDNQSLHSVVNGDTMRCHMVIDVRPNPKLQALMRDAVFDPGEDSPDLWEKTGGPGTLDRVLPLVYGWARPLSAKEKREKGLPIEGFGSMITDLGKRAKLLGTPLQEGDIMTDVNGVDTNPVARTAFDQIELEHLPGETVTIGVLRDDKRVECKIKLKPSNYFDPIDRVRVALGGKPKKPDMTYI